MNTLTSLPDLERRRQQLQTEISQLGLMRQGSLSESYRKCGKPSCHCAREDGLKHGPFYILTRKDEHQKTVGQAIPPDFLDITRLQIQEYHHFRNLCRELVNINDAICALTIRQPRSASPEETSQTAEKKTLKASSARASKKNSPSS